MEYIHSVLVQIPATKGSEAEALYSELEDHRAIASTMRGFQGMRVSRTAHPEGNILLAVETRWANNNAMVDYSTARENAFTIVEKNSDLTVPGTLQTHRLQSESGEKGEAPNRFYDRLALALFVPLGVLAFVLIAVYGLSRIYLALPTAGASIMAIIVAVMILGVCFYFASNPRAPRWAWLGVAVVGIAALGIGGTVAAYVDENEDHGHGEGPVVVEPTPPGPPGIPVIRMEDNRFEQTSYEIPAGAEIPVENNGTALHNINVAVEGSFADGTCDDGAPGCSDPNQIRGGQDGTLTLDVPPGTYDFRCDFHIDEMSGTLTVVAAPPGGPEGAPPESAEPEGGEPPAGEPPAE